MYLLVDRSLVETIADDLNLSQWLCDACLLDGSNSNASDSHPRVARLCSAYNYSLTSTSLRSALNILKPV